jgi:malate dehydrogenase (quinone)
MITGTDVDYGALTHLLVADLNRQGDFEIRYNTEVETLTRGSDGPWTLGVRRTRDNGRETVRARFVFLGAGGAAVELLQKSKIPEGVGYGGFPVSGAWLRCEVDAVAQRHHAKVYGKAAAGSPPMSVPHLDTRIIGGKRSLLFGPYAGFSMRFLKHGSMTDLLSSITHANVLPLLEVARDNAALEEYLIGQVLQSTNNLFGYLLSFLPGQKKHDWIEAVAGQRVQIIKPDKGDAGGELEFGTELVPSADRSLIALLGASPGASTAASIALDVLATCFADRLTENAWLPKLRRIIPTYGIDLIADADATKTSRKATAAVLGIENV